MKTSPMPSSRALQGFVWPVLVTLVGGVSLAVACGDDDIDQNTTGTSNGGSSSSVGGGGTSATAGTGGGAGIGGSAVAMAGSAGAGGGMAGSVGLGDAGVASGPSGVITVLSPDPSSLHFPTTAAIRNSDLFVVNGQLDAIGGTPTLPFNVVSVPLAGGAVGVTNIALPGNDFFPEGIASTVDGTLYVGSATLGTIVRIGVGSNVPDATPFVAPGVAERGVVGIATDEMRDRLWFCDSSPSNPTGGALVGINLDTGALAVRHAMPSRGGDAADAGPGNPPTFCNDLVVALNGNIFVTDSSGRIFRILSADVNTPNSASVWLESPAITVPGGFGANGIDLIGTTLIVASNGLVALNSESETPAVGLRTISLTEGGAPATLCGPDGLQTVPNSTNEIVVVENGSCAAGRARVVKVTLNLD